MRFAYWELFTLLFISWSFSVTYECEISTTVGENGIWMDHKLLAISRQRIMKIIEQSTKVMTKIFVWVILDFDTNSLIFTTCFEFFF